ncbi:hypothetical protein [Arsenophonus endosymbiont of Aleurodicus floccissimus]|uniref:hypothetical protein n=1 Tax=Arsenophonus endosymbiont of Aleurodicus floccissimus TaxID=2152761 RepID=UPI000E6AEACD|nr:hypothetical protein [Arsenophonus endosymbiont of Aleurodicus floccissimus]
MNLLIMLLIFTAKFIYWIKNEYFTIEYQENSYQITPCITVAQPSEFDDIIFYPKGYSQIIKVNLSAGNYILTDMSKTGKIILAGKDNNVVVVNYGTGNIEIFLQSGNNKIFTHEFTSNAIFDYSDNNLILSSKDNNNKIIIYDYEKYKDNVEINSSLNNGLLLTNKNIELLINAASTFQQENVNSLLSNLSVDEKSLIK